MSLVDNIGGILVLRFLLGFFGSPCLATVGASYGDFYDAAAMPYVIALWGGGATLGPALGPLVAGFAVQAKGWRWSSWELLCLSAPIMVLMFFSMPETSSDTILRRRAQRLRARTGRTDLRSQSEIRQAEINPRQITFNALIKPWEINALDPAVFFSTFYTALTYGIYYSFFESFPLVYGDVYGFNIGEQGLAFLAVLSGLYVAVVLLCCYFYFVAPKQLGKYNPDSIPPEARIWPGLFATWLIPIGLYIFGKFHAHLGTAPIFP
jgi:DHA1 family multidrug resistance protein-like MFS transporter